jgi:hypothetical protein
MLLNEDEVGEPPPNENGLAATPKIEVGFAPEVGDAVVAVAPNEKLVILEDGGCGVLKLKPGPNEGTSEYNGGAVVIVGFVCASAVDPNPPNNGLVAEAAVVVGFVCAPAADPNASNVGLVAESAIKDAISLFFKRPKKNLFSFIFSTDRRDVDLSIRV